MMMKIASVAIVAVWLLLMPAVQTVSQQPAEALLRARIVNGLNTAFSAILQASEEGIQLDRDEAKSSNRYRDHPRPAYNDLR